MKNPHYLIILAFYAYVLSLVAGTAYLVFWKGIDPWWWVLTLMLLYLGQDAIPNEKGGEAL